MNLVDRKVDQLGAQKSLGRRTAMTIEMLKRTRTDVMIDSKTEIEIVVEIA